MQKFVDLNWIDFANIDTTNYSVLTIFNNKFICTGSIRDNQQLALEIDIENNKINMLPNLIYKRCAHQAQLFQNKLYVLGGMFGSTRKFGMVDEVESFDGTIWKKHASMPFANYCFATAATLTHLFIFGGLQADQDGRLDGKPTSNVFKYDPLKDSWIKCKNMPFPQSHFTAHFLNDYIYIFITCYDAFRNKKSKTSCLRYDPKYDVWKIVDTLPRFEHFGNHTICYVCE